MFPSFLTTLFEKGYVCNHIIVTFHYPLSIPLFFGDSLTQITIIDLLPLEMGSKDSLSFCRINKASATNLRFIFSSFSTYCSNFLVYTYLCLSYLPLVLLESPMHVIQGRLYFTTSNFIRNLAYLKIKIFIFRFLKKKFKYFLLLYA